MQIYSPQYSYKHKIPPILDTILLRKKKSLGPWEIDQINQTFSPLVKENSKIRQKIIQTQKKLQLNVFHINQQDEFIKKDQQQKKMIKIDKINMRTHRLLFYEMNKKQAKQKINNLDRKSSLNNTSKSIIKPKNIINNFVKKDTRSKTAEIKFFENHNVKKLSKTATLLSNKIPASKFIDLQQMIKKTLANYELNEKLSIMYAHPGHFTKRSFKTRSAYGKYRDSSVNF